MRCPPALPHETERLHTLEQYGLGSTQELPSLQPIVEITAKMFNVPTSAVNMVGRDEVFFAASFGLGECDMARDISFCAHTITQDDVLVVEDARLDSRFDDNPLVLGPAQIRFYAGVPVRSPEGHALGALCVIDGTPRYNFSEEDRARLKDLAKLVSDRLELQRLSAAGKQGVRLGRMALTTPNGLLCVSGSGVIMSLNPAVKQIFGYKENELLGGRLDVLIPGWRASRIARRSVDIPPGEGMALAIDEDLIARHASGKRFPIEVSATAWFDEDGCSLGLVLRDVTHQRRLQDDLHRLANFDQVTGLANLNRFRERLGQEQSAAVLSLGLDGFRELSDTLDVETAEKVLQAIAERLLDGVRTTDTVARIADDEFGICLSGVGDPLRAREAADVALAAVAQPISVDGFEVRPQAHCGIALYPSHGSDSGDLISNASIARQEARSLSQAEPLLFVPALRMRAVARRMFDNELHLAVERGELQLYFQPQVRLSDGALTGAEALLRWNHPLRGLLSPAAFLPALEESPLAIEVGNWIIDTACRNAAQWRQNLSPDFRMSINLFAAQFRDPELRATVNQTAARYGLPGSAIELEITESTVLDDEALFLPLLSGLSEDGILLAFDDFGTGFASLSLLARYPLTHVKIDKSFIQKAFSSDRDRVIVQGMAELAHRLQLKVIAEGVESWPSFDFCKNIGCDEVQGFLIGKPVVATQFGAAWGQWSGKLALRA